MLSTTLRRVLVASGLTVATSFMTAFSASANTVTSSTGFTGTIAPSVAIVTDFVGKTTANTYTPTAYAGAGESGGVKKLETTDTISFNSNSDTLGVTATVTATPPTAPLKATALVGEHTAVVSNTTAATTDSSTITKTGSGAATANNFITDVQGNLNLTVKSTWLPQAGTPAGEELFNGVYAATVALSVVAN